MTLTADDHFRSLDPADQEWVREFRRRVAAADFQPLSTDELHAMQRGLQDGVACHALEDMHETPLFKQLRLEALAARLPGRLATQLIGRLTADMDAQSRGMATAG